MTKICAIILAISMIVSIFAMSFNANAQEGIKEVGLYLYDTGSNGKLSANFPQGNNTTEVKCSGSQSVGSSAFGYVNPNAEVGTWKLGKITSSVKISADVRVIFWAKSDDGAKDTTFRFWIDYNGDTIANFQVNAGDLTSIPKKVIATGSLDSEIELKPGDTFELQIHYFAGSNPIVGNDAEILVGGVIQGDATNLAVKPNSPPITIGTISAKADENVVVISTSISEPFGADLNKMFYNLIVTGPTAGRTFSAVKTSGDGNNTTISFNWNYKEDGAVDGKYSIGIGVSYDGKKFVQNSTQVDIVFPKKEEEKKESILGLPRILGIDPIIIIVGVVIIVGLGIGGFLVIKRRKAMIKFKEVRQEQPIP